MNAEKKREHKRLGLCVDCSSPQHAGTTRCEAHLEARRVHDATAGRFRKARGAERPREEGSVITYDDLDWPDHDGSNVFEVMRRVKALVATEVRLRHRIAGDAEIRPSEDRTEALRGRTRVRLAHRVSANEEIRRTVEGFTKRLWDGVNLGGLLLPTTLEEVQEIATTPRRELFRRYGRQWNGRRYTAKALEGVAPYADEEASESA